MVSPYTWNHKFAYYLNNRYLLQRVLRSHCSDHASCGDHFSVVEPGVKLISSFIINMSECILKIIGSLGETLGIDFKAELKWYVLTLQWGKKAIERNDYFKILIPQIQ